MNPRFDYNAGFQGVLAAHVEMFQSDVTRTCNGVIVTSTPTVITPSVSTTSAMTQSSTTTRPTTGDTTPSLTPTSTLSRFSMINSKLNNIRFIISYY